MESYYYYYYYCLFVLQSKAKIDRMSSKSDHLAEKNNPAISFLVIRISMMNKEMAK